MHLKRLKFIWYALVKRENFRTLMPDGELKFQPLKLIKECFLFVKDAFSDVTKIAEKHDW